MRNEDHDARSSTSVAAGWFTGSISKWRHLDIGYLFQPRRGERKVTGVVNWKPMIVRTAAPALPRLVQPAVDTDPRPPRKTTTEFGDDTRTDRGAKGRLEKRPLSRREEVALVHIRLKRARSRRGCVVLVFPMSAERYLFGEHIGVRGVRRPIGDSTGLILALVTGTSGHNQVYGTRPSCASWILPPCRREP